MGGVAARIVRARGCSRRAGLRSRRYRSRPALIRSMTPILARSSIRAALASVALLTACADAPTDPSTLAAPGDPLAKKGGNPSSLPDRYILPGATVFPEGIAYDQRTGTV